MSALGAASATWAYRFVRRFRSCSLPPPHETDNRASACSIAGWQFVGTGAVHAATTPERFKSAAPTVSVTNLVPRFSADNWVLTTSEVSAPVQAALERRWIRFSASRRYG